MSDEVQCTECDSGYANADPGLPCLSKLGVVSWFIVYFFFGTNELYGCLTSFSYKKNIAQSEDGMFNKMADKYAFDIHYL